MIDLTNLEEIKKLDPKDVFGSTGMLANQCKHVWETGGSITFPQNYRNVSNIVICGMGGSSFGGRIIPHLYKDSLSIPVSINDDYHLPAYVNDSTLVILTSYSGNTEESLSCGKEALQKNAKVVGLTSGGKLADFLKANNLPAIVFEPKFNPSSQPRLAPGYIVFGTIRILSNIGLINTTDNEVSQAITELEQSQQSVIENARNTAQNIVGFIPVIFAAEFLKGNAHVFRNQINETAKSFSTFSQLPELNHHLMEGLKNPPDKKLITLFIESNFYSDVLKKRIFLTKDVVGKNHTTALTYQAEGSTKLSQVLNVLSFGGYVSFYLALLYNQDPSLVHWVDYFKEKLAKSS